ncbi:MAG: HAD family hydrolase [Fusobacteriaceae bacterium]
MIKLIAIDMDGTLLNDNHEIDPEFWSTFQKLKQQNIKFSIASGRQYSNLLERFHDIQDDIIFICENGSLIMYKNKEIFADCLSKEHVKYCVAKTIGIKNIGVVLCGKSTAYINDSTLNLITEVERYYKSYRVVKDFAEVTEDIVKIAIYDFINSATNVYPHFKDDSEKFQVVVSALHWMDIMNNNSNKGTAIKKTQDFFGITFDETMVFGDYLNDLEMMKEAYHSYAMGNAHPEIKATARFITKTNNENGVTFELKKLL